MSPTPIILFNSATGSDVAASGAGPTVALTGVLGVTVNGSGNIAITDAVDLSSVATDGSACLWIKTSSGRQFSKITGVSGVSENWTVVVEDTVWTDGSNLTWGIGGKRATWDDADSRNLRSDAKAGWTIETETDQTISSVIIGNCVGSATAGYITWRGSSGSIKSITQSANASHFQSTGANNPTLWHIKNLKFVNTNGTKTSARAFYMGEGVYFFQDCIFGSQANTIKTALARASGICVFNLNNCEIAYCTDIGISLDSNSELNGFAIYVHHNTLYGGIVTEGSTIRLGNSIISYNTGDGIYPATSASKLVLENCTITNNTGDGIDISQAAVSNILYIKNCNITANGNYGIRAHANQLNFNTFVDYNNYGTGATANTSGAMLNLAAGDHDFAIDPGYVDAANGNFTITNSNLLGVGFPAGYIGAGQSLTHSYVDIGAAQRQRSQPSVGNVREGILFDDATQTGVCKLPDEDDVRLSYGFGYSYGYDAGLGYDNYEYFGLLDLPAVNVVKSGIQFDSLTKTGTLTSGIIGLRAS